MLDSWFVVSSSDCLDGFFANSFPSMLACLTEPGSFAPLPTLLTTFVRVEGLVSHGWAAIHLSTQLHSQLPFASSKTNGPWFIPEFALHYMCKTIALVLSLYSQLSLASSSNDRPDERTHMPWLVLAWLQLLLFVVSWQLFPPLSRCLRSSLPGRNSREGSCFWV